MRKIIIQGSSNSKGNTYEIVKYLQEKLDCDFLDLSQKNILPFDYNFNNQGDDFLPIIKKILNDYDVIIFASPVYWYTMSGTLKIFFDRFTDCLLKEKDLGPKFNGKHMAALCCGSSEEEIEAYFTPFKKSAAYLKMNYIGDLHTWKDENPTPTEVLLKVDKFAALIKES